MGMKKTMQQFQIEWHNLSSSGRIKTNESGYLPDVIKHNEELSEKMKLLESEVDRYRKSAEYIIKNIPTKRIFLCYCFFFKEKPEKNLLE